MQNTFNIKNFSFLISIIACVIILITQVDSLSRRNRDNALSISWDVYAYYLYLPATIIYNDPGLEDKSWTDLAQEKYKAQPMYFYQVSAGRGNKRSIIVTQGMAFFYLPGFLLAHVYSKIAGVPADGFSYPYQWSLLITSILIALANVFLLRWLLLRFFNDTVSTIVLMIICLGTNFLFQAGITPTMPHTFMFFINVVILLLSKKIYDEQYVSNRLLIITALLVGWGGLCRPPNLLMGLIPFFILCNLHYEKKLFPFSQLAKHIFKFSGIILLVFSISVFYSLYANGDVFRYDRNESLDLFHPYTINFLFSFKNGWLVYTPIMILAFAGMFTLNKMHPAFCLPVLAVFLIHLWVISSWDAWWYGVQLGQRGMVDIYPVIAIIIGSFVAVIISRKLHLKIPAFTVIVVLVMYNMLQTWQYTRYMLLPLRMNETYYKKIFLKTFVSEGDYKKQDPDRMFSLVNQFSDDENLYYKKTVADYDFETLYDDFNKSMVADTLGCNSLHCYKIDSAAMYSPGLNEKYYDLTCKNYLWLKVSVDVFPTPNDANNSALVVTMISNGKNYEYMAKIIGNEFKVNQWNHIEVSYLTPILRHNDDRVLVYCYNPNKEALFIDNIKVTALERKRDQ